MFKRLLSIITVFSLVAAIIYPNCVFADNPTAAEEERTYSVEYVNYYKTDDGTIVNETLTPSEGGLPDMMREMPIAMVIITAARAVYMLKTFLLSHGRIKQHIPAAQALL